MMTTDAIAIIDKKIDELIKDKNEYGFNTLKEKVESILKSVDIFLIDNQLDNKATDLYLKTVITQRNEIQKEQEKTKIKTDNSVSKYALIEEICKKLSFETQKEVIQKVQQLEKKTIFELTHMNNSL